MGWSPIRTVKKAVSNVAGAVSDVGAAVDDAIIAPIVDPIVEAGRQFEDRVRDGVEGIDEAIQNPYVRMVVGAVAGPQAKAIIDAYAKLDSGEELDTADYIALGISGAEELGDVEIPDEVEVGIKVGTRLNAGEDPVDIYIDEVGEDYVADLELDTKLDTTIRDYYGDDVADLLKDNKNMVQLATDIVVNGEDPSAAIAKYYGQDIVDYLDIGDPAGYAALKTAVALDQGLSTQDAVLSGTEEYFKRGGELPDAQKIADIAGIDADIDFDMNKFVTDMGINWADLKDKYSIPALANLNIDLGQFNFEAPDVVTPDYSLPELADYGVDLGKVDFSGYKTSDIGDYNLKELGDMGIDVNTLDLNPEFQMIGLAQLLEGGQPDIPTKKDEEVVSLESEFDLAQNEEPLFSREVLGRSFS